MAQLPTVGGDQDSWGDILNQYLLVSHTANGRMQPLVVSYSYAATITPDVDTTEVATVGILTGNISIANPTGTPIDGQELAFRFTQDGTGSRTVTWGSAYAFDTSTTVPNSATAANAIWEISFRWNAATSVWAVVGNSVTISEAQINGLVPQQTPNTTGTALTFVADTVYGSVATPVTGNITANTTGALLGVTNLIIHKASVVPTFDANFQALSSSRTYVTGNLNYIFCEYLAAGNVIYSIQQST